MTRSGYGWGLPTAWDAFQDGSTNPVDTIYGIDTAFGIKALLDDYVASGSEQSATSAIAALDYYASLFVATDDGGFFPYSNQPSDAVDTANTSAMLMGQFARASSLFGRNDYRTWADMAFADLWADRIESDNGDTHWTYSDDSKAPNDAVHAAWIVQGLLDYVVATGNQTGYLALSAIFTAS